MTDKLLGRRIATGTLLVCKKDTQPDSRHDPDVSRGVGGGRDDGLGQGDGGDLDNDRERTSYWHG